MGTKFRRWWSANRPLIIIGAISVVLLVVGIVLKIYDDDARRSCEDHGGIVEEYNHRTIMITQSCGKDCFFTAPIQTSDWRCVITK